MLKRIVEHCDVDSLSNRLPDPSDAVGCRNHRHSRVQALVHSGLVAAVTSQHDFRLQSALSQSPGEPRSTAPLPGPSYSHVTNAEDRNGEFFRLKDPPLVELCATGSGDGVQC